MQLAAIILGLNQNYCSNKQLSPEWLALVLELQLGRVWEAFIRPSADPFMFQTLG
jgi:hypothetical protein